MAEQLDQDQKTEAPTARRREDARREGDLLASRELVTAMSGIAGALWLFLFGARVAARFRDAGAAALAINSSDLADWNPVGALLAMLGTLALPLAALAILVLVAVIAGRALTGGLVFAPKLLEPKAERLDPLKGLTRIFGRQGLVELLKALAKAALLLGMGAAFLWRDRGLLAGLSTMPLEAAMPALLDRGVFLFLALTAGLFIIAGGDLPVQFLQWLKKLRMTRQELKDEMKQTEGRPEVKAALRRMQHQLRKAANRSAVRDASVVLVNPGHFAVALRYRPGEDLAPVIVARGRGPVALAIRELAAEFGVVTLAYPAVARALYFTGRVGQTIRTDLYVAVATILAFVMRVNALPKDARVYDNPPDVEVPEGLRYDSEGRRETTI
ncbi:EscU/YscU/HrcU family type III secretion system export apparatus switch protein [Thermaurantiacus sp.]